MVSLFPTFWLVIQAIIRAKKRKWTNIVFMFEQKLLLHQRALPPKTADSYFLMVRPALLLLRAVGRFPYSITETGVKPFKLFSIPAIYTLLFYITELCLTVRFLFAIMKNHVSTHLNEFILLTGVALFPSQIFVVPLVNWWSAPKLVKYIEMWKDFQNNYKMDLEYKGNNKVKVVTYPAFWILSGFAQFYLVTNLTDPLLYLPFFTIIATSVALECIWIDSLRNVQYLSQKLFNRIAEDELRNCEVYRAIWFRLSDLMTSIGDAFGLTYIILGILFFTNCVFCTYGFLCYIIYNHPKLSGTFFSISYNMCLSFFAVVLISDVAHKATEAVMLLIRTLSYSPPKIELLGFVSLSRNLFTAFLIHIVTFLVVLLQSADQNVSSLLHVKE